MENLLSIMDVARILGVTRMTVWRQIKGENLKAFRVGRQVRITQESLDEYLQKNKMPTRGKKKIIRRHKVNPKQTTENK